MRILLEDDSGNTTELTPDIIPKDADVILMRTSMMLKPEDSDKISRALTKAIGKATVLLPAWVKDVTVIPTESR